MQDPTFIDALSADTIRNVFRFFSESPHAIYWQGYLDFDNLRQLYLGEGPLSESCRRSFPAIELGMATVSSGRIPQDQY